MARSTEYIANFIKSRIAAKANISPLASNPDWDNSIIGQFVESVAETISEADVIADDHMDTINEALDGNMQPHTTNWIRNKAFEFQYDEDTLFPLVRNGQAVEYETLDESARLVSMCVIRPGGYCQCSVITAKNDPPEKMSTLEVDALADYFNNVLRPSRGMYGVLYNVTSLDPDIVTIEADIHYDGRYHNIKESVIDAIEGYIHNLGTTGIGVRGYFSASKLIATVRAVPGVVDFVIEELAIRDSGTAFGSRTVIATGYLVDYNTYPIYQLTSGYGTTETESTYELENRLTLIAV